ncbi:MAG: TonB-dependent receptor plug domain-containing protein, partial [Gammaproteobacteria bacterium]|nr:TonB-dependent receptor plug domain-containing protein [Gammaproteobacteria bacterium]
MTRSIECGTDRTLCRYRAILMAALLCCAGEAAWSGDWQGQELRDVIEALRQDGLSVLYSSGLIQSGMPVRTEPAGDTVIARLEAALEPWGLGLRAGPYGSVLIVRRPVPENRRGSSAKVVPAHASVMPELVVTTSRYTMLREPVAPAAVMPNTDVERLPDLGDDPLRAVARLPGTAINGLSAKTNIRGGGADETLVVFDDLRLFNPFHLKDFQSVFSSIDPAVIDGLDIYTGAFPTNYGDRLSGVLDIQALEPPGGSYRALSLSLFSAAGLFAGDWNDGRGTWLVSARRGNLDIMLDLAGQDMGKPRYSDVHGQLGWEFSEAFRLSANALVFDDDIEIHDSDQEERATATYHDSYLWLRADNRLGSALDGYTLLSWASLRSRREGTAEQPGISVGSLADHRSADIIGLATSWSLALAGRQRLDFGAELRHSRGRYAYNDQVSFDLLFDTPGAPTEA